MNVDSLRKVCMTLPHVTEDVKWGDNLCFLIAGKMFAITSLDGGALRCLTLKVAPERFDEYVERPNISQAKYCAKRQWISLERWDALRDDETRQAIFDSYQLVRAKLPKRVLAALESATVAKAPARLRKQAKSAKKAKARKQAAS